MRDDSGMPAPPIPHDTDLRHMPGYMIDTQRLLDSDLAALGDPAANWYAMLCWCASMHQVPAGSLPDDDAMLAYLVRLGRDVKTWRKMRAKGALRGWVKCSDGRLYHSVVTENVLKLLEKSRAGRKAVAAREASKSDQRIDIQQSHAIDRSSDDERSMNNRREGNRREEIRDNHNPEAAALNPVARDAAAAMAEGAMGNPWTPILEAFADGCVDGGGVRTFSGSPDDRLCAKRLMDAGANPEMVRFVTSAITERQKAKGKAQPSTIRYVERAVMDAIAEPPPEMPKPEAKPQDLRRAALERFIRDGSWIERLWGPAPTMEQAQAELSGAKVAA